MDIEKRFLSIFELLLLSVKTYLKALPFLLVGVFLPLVLAAVFTFPYLKNIYNYITVSVNIFSVARLPAIFLGFIFSLNIPVIISIAVFIMVLAYGVVFSYFITENIIKRERQIFLSAFFSSFAALGRYFAAYISFIMILCLFYIVPPLLAALLDLGGIFNLIIYGAWFALAIVSVFFIYYSLFFARAAILRGKWPRDTFYYSYDITRKYPLKIILYFILVAIVGAVWFWLVDLFANYVIFASIFELFDIGQDTPIHMQMIINAAYTPAIFIINVLAYMFISMCITVLFLNMDYNLNAPSRMELYSRAHAVNDNAMPTLNIKKQ
ncbi:MAG: hypothetical protein LBM71_01185 [Elusimicrobiota bacterium]|jgi:hypothetical protein|nr:hypothetical protein [Elusimicrobiota bacterium]